MNFTTFPPSSQLAPFVELCWVLEGSGAGAPFEKILPDGCTEMIFHFDGTFNCRTHLRETIQPAHFVFGQLTRFIEIKPVANVFTIGVKFKPAGLAPFCKCPQFTLRDEYHDPENVLHLPEHLNVAEIKAAATPADKWRLIQQGLESMLSKANPDRLATVHALSKIIEHLKETQGRMRIVDAAKKHLHTSRDLERKFRELVGLTPKALSTIYRFQRVMELKDKFSNLTSLACEASYFDQAHFVRDFKRITGTSPKALLRSDTTLTEIFLNKGSS
jgi:AraC-like DNA-binding protein